MSVSPRLEYSIKHHFAILYFMVRDDRIEVDVARLDERLTSIDAKQEDMHTDIKSILDQMKIHAEAINNYSNDRQWVVGIFGVCYGALIAWIEYRMHS